MMTKVGNLIIAIILMLEKVRCGAKTGMKQSEKRFLGSTRLNIITRNPASVVEVMSAVMDDDLI
jgi:hypothetical protein